MNLLQKQKYIRMALHCVEAYDDPNCVDTGTGRAEAHVRYDRDLNLLEIALAGTNDRHDILDDFKIFGGDTMAGTKVHGGLYAYAKRLEVPLYSRMRELRVPENARIELAGHSLGGGAIFPLVIRNPFFKAATCDVVTFNAPRFFGPTGALLWKAQGVACTLLRIESRGDTVSKLPPAMMGFAHIGESLLIGKGWDWRPDHGIAQVIQDLRDEPVTG